MLVTLKAATMPLARRMGPLHGCFEGNRLCPDLELAVDLVGVVHQDEGQRQGGLAEKWSKDVQCRRLYGAVVGMVMVYAVLFVFKHRGVRVAGIRRVHRVMSKMKAYTVLRAAVGKVVAKEQIEMLNWTSVMCTLKEYAVLRTAVTSRAVVCKVVAKKKNEMGKVVARSKKEMTNWSSVRCTLKEYAMLEPPWARHAVRLAVCFAVEAISDLADV